MLFSHHFRKLQLLQEVSLITYQAVANEFIHTFSGFFLYFHWKPWLFLPKTFTVNSTFPEKYAKITFEINFNGSDLITQVSNWKERPIFSIFILGNFRFSQAILAMISYFSWWYTVAVSKITAWQLRSRILAIIEPWSIQKRPLFWPYQNP